MQEDDLVVGSYMGGGGGGGASGGVGSAYRYTEGKQLGGHMGNVVGMHPSTPP